VGVAPPSWQTLKMGAGGFITGISIADDGTKVCRCDTYGAYKGGPGTIPNWKPLITESALPSGAWRLGTLNGYFGAYETVIAPSDSTRIYMYAEGLVFRSDDGGVSFVQTNFSSVSAGSNAGDRLMGPFMAVDPANPDICLTGTPTSGVFYTIDKGVTWTHIAGITNGAPPTTGGILIGFDRSSSVVSGATQGIYVSSYGTGVYHSTSGVPGSWTLTVGTPTTHGHMTVDRTGRVWLTDNSNALHKYAGGAWSSVSTPLGVTCVDVDPSNSNNVYALSTGFGGAFHYQLFFSTNGATSWSEAAAIALDATDIPWMGPASSPSLSNGPGSTWTATQVAIDPQNGIVWALNGIGIIYTTTPQTTGTLTWIDKSAPIEQLQMNVVICPTWSTGGQVFGAAWDRPLWAMQVGGGYPANYQPASDYNNVQIGYDIDFAAGTSGFLVGVADQGYYSTDSGATYTAFATGIPNYAGFYNGGNQIAASSNQNFIAINTQNSDGKAYYTLNGGSSWTVVSISGVGGGFATFVNGRQSVAADRTRTLNWLIYVLDATNPGIYKSSDGGATWALKHAGRFDGGNGDDNNSAILKGVPGNSGHWFYTPGIIGPYNVEHGGKAFQKSTDDGATWTSISTINNVWCYGFGKAKPGGGGYPAIFAVGWVSNVFGIWRSDDIGVTWIAISDVNGFPGGWLDFICGIDGDMSNYGRCYVAFGQSGGSGCMFYGPPLAG
jgi:hypothetical protein